MKNAKIEEVFEFIRNGASIKQGGGKTGTPITRIETIWNETIDQNRFGYANILEDDLIKYEKYLLQEGDILMSHINSPKHLGKCALYQGVPKTLIHGMNLLALRAKKDICVPQYLNYFFNSKFFKIQLSKISNQSVNQASFSAGNLKKLDIPLPPLETQERIAQILDDANALRQKTEKLLEEYDTLAQSIFLDMFGDPVTNPKGFDSKLLSKAGSFKNGLNFSKGEKGYSVKYIGVGDFKSKVKIDDLNTLSEVQLEKAPNKDYFLKDGDLLFVRSNGNKSLVGRCIAVYPGQDKVTFSGFCIKFSPIDEVKSTYLSFLFKTASMKQKMLGGGRGANIQNVNQQILGRLEIPVPTERLQIEFTEKIALIDKQKEIAKQELAESEDLFNCLRQKAFKGELV